MGGRICFCRRGDQLHTKHPVCCRGINSPRTAFLCLLRFARRRWHLLRFVIEGRKLGSPQSELYTSRSLTRDRPSSTSAPSRGRGSKNRPILRTNTTVPRSITETRLRGKMSRAPDGEGKVVRVRFSQQSAPLLVFHLPTVVKMRTKGEGGLKS